jgi:hypothetical protein
MLAMASAARMLERPPLVEAAVRKGVPVTSIEGLWVEAFMAVSFSGSDGFAAS